MLSIKNNMRSFVAFILACIVFVCASFTPALADSNANASASVYQPSSNPMQDVQDAITAAKQSNKHVLVVMGAQWCHDSRGLVEQFNKPEMATIISKHYELVYVDVAYFNDLRHISERFGQAHYFATPTVMIIEANTEALLNASSMAQWGNADSIEYADYVQYFERYSVMRQASSVQMSQQHRSQIDAFKKHQGERLMQAYIKLTPGMIKEDKTKQPDEAFFALWREVKTFRTQLQQDIQSLNQQAQAMHKNASGAQPLVLPTYPAFSWHN
ncbi:MAG: thioredoxin family protein [Glaciecola sp.]